MKKNIKKIQVVFVFALLLIVTEGKALKNSIKTSLGYNKQNELDKRITDLRKKIKEQLKDQNADKTLVEFKKYSHESDWVNWTNWGNWSNWNNWNNWDKWANWSNQWSNFLNS